MITVFLSNEAQDVLIEQFEENGFQVQEETQWASDILLELTEICMSIRCHKTGKQELYRIRCLVDPAHGENRQIGGLVGVIDKLHGGRMYGAA